MIAMPSFGLLMVAASSRYKIYTKPLASVECNLFLHLVFGGFVSPPRVHIFLWLLSNNKILTRMNLQKHRDMDDVSCLFCTEQETVSHLFFDCCVAKVLWIYLSEIFHISLGVNFESVARWWVSNRKYKVMNCFSAALMLCLWKFRNEMCFQGKGWKGEKIILQKLCNMVKKWRILFSEGDLELLDQVLTSLYSKLAQPLGLPNVPQYSPTRSSPGNGSSLETFPGRASTYALWVNAEDDGLSTEESICITACASVLPICASRNRLATLNSSGRALNMP